MTDQPTQPTPSREPTWATVTIPAGAADTFRDAWSDQFLADELGTKLTCLEVDALGELLAALGAPEAARMWIDMHAEGDEPDDLHYAGRGPTEEPAGQTDRVGPTDNAEKIAKLLAKAEGTGNPYEAETFTSHAKRLMIKWGVEEALVRARMAGTGTPSNGPA